MSLLVRFPRITAWLVVLALLGIVTFGALQGLRALDPSSPAGMEHVHGVITAMRGNNLFAVHISGHTGVEWFHVAPGAHISLAHLRRHMYERAPTDVYYQEEPHGQLLAWIAD